MLYADSDTLFSTAVIIAFMSAAIYDKFPAVCCATILLQGTETAYCGAVSYKVLPQKESEQT